MTNNKWIESFDDIKGMVLRTQENKYLMQFWKTVGANPTFIPTARSR
jgi:TRAP-type C4-dicarboxylate transport system substrate-binding protein